MTNITDRIAMIRAMEVWLEDRASHEVAAAGEILQSALAGATAGAGVPGEGDDTSEAGIDAARIDRGDSPLRSQDAQYQTADWTRAAGRSDLGHDDLFDS